MQNGKRELAILGGTPRFGATLHVGAPNIGDRDALFGRIAGVLERRWLTNYGCLVQEFERRIEDETGARHCIAVANATVGLQLVFRALGLTGEAILPSFTFVATAHALQWMGITPVFCDIDEATHRLDPACVERAITPATQAIVGVHIWGQPCAVEALADIAARRGLALIFDAAHAFGCSAGATRIGNFGRAEVFSFHATKFVNAFEGGAIATNDDALAARLRMMINFGFAGTDNVACLGTNAKMHEVSAAMGLTSLDAMPHILARNSENHQAYRFGLSRIRGVRLLRYAQGNRQNHQYVVAEIDERAAGLDRDALVAALWAENVRARRYFHPGCHRMAPYRALRAGSQLFLPATEAVCRRVFLLPTGTSVTGADIAACCDLIGQAIREGDQIRAVLAQGNPMRSQEALLFEPRSKNFGNVAPVLSQP